MGFEFMEPQHRSNSTKLPTAANQSPGVPNNQQQAPSSGGTPYNAPQNNQPVYSSEIDNYQEPTYREHVSSPLVWDHTETGRFRPAYPAYPANYQQPGANHAQQPIYTPGQPVPNQAGPGYYSPGHPAYIPPSYGYPGYYGYPYAYPYYWAPPKPRRDGYLFTISIISFIASILVLLGGILCALILLLVLVAPRTGILPAQQFFSSIVLFTALSVACLVGGSFSLYHSMRALFWRKPSAAFKLPQFWIFLALYILVAIIGAALHANNASISNIPVTILLIALAGVLPALTILALGVRQVSNVKENRWPTTWRRFTLAIVSGTTSAILFATIFEAIITVVLGKSLNITGFSLDNPNQPIPQDFKTLTFMFLLLSVMAPIVEEAVKPLAVVALIGRIRSASEAFVLGLACGIGFDLIETSGYISQGYQDWLKVALERSTAGLLHGFGAAMMALGWYYLTHPKSTQRRFLLGFGCMAYALIQHAVWNGTFVLQILPDPVGSFFSNGKVPLGPISFDAELIPYVVLSILMITFFVFVTNKLRTQNSQQPPALPQQQPVPINHPIPTRAY